MEKTFQREVACLLIPGTDFVSITTNNNPGAVEFDFFRLWEYYKENKKHITSISLIHTHPPGFDEMSITDRNMVDGWYKAFSNLRIEYSIIQNNLETFYRHKNNNPFKFKPTDSVAQTLMFLSYKQENPTESELKLFEELCQTAIHMGW